MVICSYPFYCVVIRSYPWLSVSAQIDVVSLKYRKAGRRRKFSTLKNFPVYRLMAIVSVVRYSRKKIIGDDTSPVMHFIKQKAGDAKVFDIKRLANEIEAIGALSAEDVIHVVGAFVRSMKRVLRDGNRVKVDGLGTFYITLSCPGVEVEKECTVKSIKRVNLRFKVDNTLRLANDSTATTRGGENNVEFELAKPGTGTGTGDGAGDDGEDPTV